MSSIFFLQFHTGKSSPPNHQRCFSLSENVPAACICFFSLKRLKYFYSVVVSKEPCIFHYVAAPWQLPSLIIYVMARFFGNIWGQALGSIGGTTFSLARDRKGKVQTARQRVIPANTQSTAQVKARANIKDSTRIAREFNADFSFAAFDYAVSKLPGYQSIVSILTNAKTVGTSTLVFNPVDYIIPRGLPSRPHFTSTNHVSGGEYTFTVTVAGDPLPSNYVLNLFAMAKVADYDPAPSFRTQDFQYSQPFTGTLGFDIGGFGHESEGAFAIAFFSAPSSYDASTISDIVFVSFNP